VLGLQWQTRKLSKKKTTKVLVVRFSAALEPGPAQNLGDYHLVALGKGKKSGAGGKPVALASASYDPAAHTVTLTPRGKVPAQSLQLTITAAGTRDVQGRPLDGNRDGQPGGDAVVTIGKGGVPIAAVSARALDALLDSGSLRTRHRRAGKATVRA
jgi:hypothetical protein